MNQPTQSEAQLNAIKTLLTDEFLPPPHATPYDGVELLLHRYKTEQAIATALFHGQKAQEIEEALEFEAEAIDEASDDTALRDEVYADLHARFIEAKEAIAEARSEGAEPETEDDNHAANGEAVLNFVELAKRLGARPDEPLVAVAARVQAFLDGEPSPETEDDDGPCDCDMCNATESPTPEANTAWVNLYTTLYGVGLEHNVLGGTMFETEEDAKEATSGASNAKQIQIFW